MEVFLDRLGKLGFGLMATGVIATRFVFVVQPGYKVVIMDKLRGLQDKEYEEGMHFRIPFIQSPTPVEVRT